MRYHCTILKAGKKQLNWSVLGPLVVANYVGMIGFAEVFWFVLTGAFNPLVGLFALVAATIGAIRIVGTSLAKPIDLMRAEAGGV